MIRLLLMFFLCLPVTSVLAQAWVTDLMHQLVSPPVIPQFQVAYGSSLYTLSSGSTFSTLTIEDRVSGERVEVQRFIDWPMALALDTDGGLLIGLGSEVLKLSTSDHQVVWRRRIFDLESHSADSAWIDGGRIFAGRYTGAGGPNEFLVKAIDGGTGLDLWSRIVPMDDYSRTFLSARGGLLALMYRSSENTGTVTVQTYDSDGSPLWTKNLPEFDGGGTYYPDGLAVLENGNVVADILKLGELVPFLLDGTDGQILGGMAWMPPEFDLGYEIAPLHLPDGSLVRGTVCEHVQTGVSGLCLQRIDPVSGVTIWTREWLPEAPESARDNSRVGLDVADGRLVAALATNTTAPSQDDQLRILAFDVATGVLDWTERYPDETPGSVSHPVVSANVGEVTVISGRRVMAGEEVFWTGGLFSLAASTATGGEIRRGHLTIPSADYPTYLSGVSRDRSEWQLSSSEPLLSVASLVIGEWWGQPIGVRAYHVDLADGSVRSDHPLALTVAGCDLQLPMYRSVPARDGKLLSIVLAVCNETEHRHGVARFDRNDGSLDWALLDGIRTDSLHERANGEVLLGAAAGGAMSLRKLLPDGATEAWSQTWIAPGLPGTVSAPLLLEHSSGALYAAAQIDGRDWWILELDPATGLPDWQRRLEFEGDAPHSKNLQLFEAEDGMLELAGTRNVEDVDGVTRMHFAVERISPDNGNSLGLTHASVVDEQPANLSEIQRLAQGRYIGMLSISGSSEARGVFSFDSAMGTMQTRREFSPPTPASFALGQLGGTEILLMERMDEFDGTFARVWRISAADLEHVIGTRTLRMDPEDMNQQSDYPGWAYGTSIHGRGSNSIVLTVDYHSSDGFSRPRVYRFDADYFADALFADGFD